MSLFSRVSDSSPILRVLARAGGRLPYRGRMADTWARVVERVSGSPRRSAWRRGAMIGGPAVTVVAGVAVWLAVRPVPQPDYLKDELDDVFGFTLLTEEFNKLPVEKRLELIGRLVVRIKDMDSSDSVLLASFAAGIAGAARDQLEENAERLAIDLWDKYAQDYAKVADADRGAFLDTTCIEFMKLMETIGGEVRDIPDSERLAEAKRQAERDKEWLSDPERRPDAEFTGQVFRFMRFDVAPKASTQQKSRGQLMMRDMVRHLRGEDSRRR